MTGMSRRGFVAGTSVFGLASGLAPAIVRAQDFPAKQVRVVVPYPAGGGTDLVARLIVPRLADRWKQTVIIDNKGGASGILGSEIVAKAAPDGTTFGISLGGPLAINTLLFSKLPYDPAKDIAPITAGIE